VGGGGATAASGMRIRRFGGIRIAMAGRRAGGQRARTRRGRKEGVWEEQEQERGGYTKVPKRILVDQGVQKGHAGAATAATLACFTYHKHTYKRRIGSTDR
jgi:hypothetical protein